MFVPIVIGVVVGCIVYNIVKASRTESGSDRADRYSRSRKD